MQAATLLDHNQETVHAGGSPFLACQQFVAGPLVVVQSTADSVVWGTAVSLVVELTADSVLLVLLLEGLVW